MTANDRGCDVKLSGQEGGLEEDHRQEARGQADAFLTRLAAEPEPQQPGGASGSLHRGRGAALSDQIEPVSKMR